MSNPAGELKHDLECLRLASDFMQISRDTRNPELQAHCARMAAYWTGRAGSHQQHVGANASDQRL